MFLDDENDKLINGQIDSILSEYKMQLRIEKLIRLNYVTNTTFNKTISLDEKNTLRLFDLNSDDFEGLYYLDIEKLNEILDYIIINERTIFGIILYSTCNLLYINYRIVFNARKYKNTQLIELHLQCLNIKFDKKKIIENLMLFGRQKFNCDEKIIETLCKNSNKTCDYPYSEIQKLYEFISNYIDQ